MSGSFTGFSEDDIRKLNKNPEESVKAHRKGNASSKTVVKAQKRANHNSNQQNNARNFTQTKILNDKVQNSPIEPIPDSAKLERTNIVKDDSHLTTPIKSDDGNVLTSVENFQIDTAKDPKISNQSPEIDGMSLQSIDLVNEKVEIKALPETKRDLDKFQAKQKLIEEQNRKRKELLIKALAVKTKQTQEETLRLNTIREEFKKLDVLLSNDVKILRQEIEVASLDYMEVQKKYFKVEKEFLEVKLSLHQKLERKEMLTEHLCTIIEKNEERKAAKLNELLLKLNLKADLEEDNNISKEQSDDNSKGINGPIVEVTTDNVTS